jgi:hypothetical protein
MINPYHPIIKKAEKVNSGKIISSNHTSTLAYRRVPNSKDLNKVISSFTVYKFIKSITQHFSQTNAFSLGVIDAYGRYLKDPEGLITPYDRLIINLKVLLAMIPNPSIKAKLNYLVTGIGLLAEDSEQLGADPHYVFTEILDYLLEQGLDLYSILDEEGMSVGGGGIAGVTDIYPSSGGDYGNTVVHRKNIVGKMLKRRRRR